MRIKLNFWVVTFCITATALVTSCGNGGDSDDQDIVDSSSGGGQGNADVSNLSPTAKPTATPINANNNINGCNGTNYVCPNGGFNGPSSRPTIPPVNPVTPIGENCSTKLELKTSVGGPNATRSYLLGRIDPACLTLSANAEVLLKSNNELTLANSLRCLSASGEFPVLCKVSDLKSFVSTDGFVMIDVLLSPSVPYVLSGKFNVIR